MATVSNSSGILYTLAAKDCPMNDTVTQTLMIHSSQYYYPSYVTIKSDGRLMPVYYLPGQSGNKDTNVGHVYYGIAIWFVSS